MLSTVTNQLNIRAPGGVFHFLCYHARTVTGLNPAKAFMRIIQSFFARCRALCALWLTCALPFSLLAYPGDHDFTFSQRGSINGPIYAVAVDALTNIWIGGRFTTVYGQPYPGIAVLHADGTLNTAFDPAAVNLLNLGEVHAFAVDFFHGVYIGAKNGMARLTYSGPFNGWSLDSSFSANASALIRQVTSLAIHSENGQTADLWAAGSVYAYTNGSGAVVRNLIRLNASGGRDSAFNLPAGLAYQGVFQIRYVKAGIGTTNSAATDHLIVAGTSGFTGRLSTTGTDPELFFDPSGYASCIAETPDTLAGCTSSRGRIIAGGFFGPAYDYNQTDITGNGIWLNRFGGSDPNYFHNISQNDNFPADRGQYASAIEAFPGGDILVAGGFTRLGGVNVNNFAHLLANGQVDTAFQNSVSFYPIAMAQQPDGKILIVGHGNFTPVTGQITRRLPMAEPRPITFTSPPASTTIYAGESHCFQAGLDVWPPAPLKWVRNGTVLTNETSASICLYNVTSGDDGDYKLRAYRFCNDGIGTEAVDSVDSASAHLTVLSAPPPPANDMFNNAIALTGSSSSATGTLRSSTLEAGERNHARAAYGHSVWWQWTAPSNGLAVIDVSDCDFAAAVGIYTGSAVGSLTLIKENCRLVDDGKGLECRGVLPLFSFPVVAGSTYHIAIGGQPGVASLGNIVMRLGVPLFGPATLLSNGTIQLCVIGLSGSKAIIEATPTLSPPNWQPISTNIIEDGKAIITLSRTNVSSRYYRARVE